MHDILPPTVSILLNLSVLLKLIVSHIYPGQDQHFGTRALPRELQLASVEAPVDPEHIRIMVSNLVLFPIMILYQLTTGLCAILILIRDF